MEYRLGIVLSGGGARAAGHIGVLKALAEEGIEPDCFSGTSGGAIVGALAAAGYSPEEMLEFFETRSPFRLSKLALRKPGFIDTEKVQRDFREFFPDDSFEALDRKLFVAATDIENARLEIFSTGPLIPAVVASASVPAVFTPTPVGDRLFSDGGIVDNLPVEPLIGLCDHIVGVYANPVRTVDRKHLKSSFAVSLRAFEVASYNASRRKFHLCDLLLCPEEIGHFGTFSTKHLGEILDVGYRAARKRMPEIRSLLSS
ncbi:MAG: patatin-like phospholipase family protein [Thermoanaerobaculia bacterium]|nr:patatin-like phospholipase family protein [Thermoanaerobaculia bacterium]